VSDYLPSDLEPSGELTSRGARWANVVGVVLVVVGTMSALALTGWHQVVRGLEAYDTSHEARAAHTPFPLTAHEIWLGDEMPKVKRMLYERNEEMLAPWGWNLRLWGLGDVTPENFPRTYAAIQRGLEHHARTGDNVFSMLGDLMKFEILYRHGGLYLDTNVELFRDPSPLFWDTAEAKREAFFVADPGDNRFISAGMIGALAPGTALLGRVVDDPAYLDGIDFARHCIANALTGPVLLTMHLEHDPSLLETVSVFDRDAAYPIACGENYLDPCVKELTRSEQSTEPRTGTTGTPGTVGDGDGGATVPGGATVGDAAAARSTSGVGSADFGATASPSTHPPPPRAPPRPENAIRRVTRTAADIAATMARRGGDAERLGDEVWRRRSVHSPTPPAVVTEADGSSWNVTVPCKAVARAYPDSYAMDHFSVGGASWQKNCDRLEKATAVVEWVERTVPPDVSLVHDWAMSAVRFLGGPEHGRELVRRVRLHQTGGVPGRSRVVVVASSLRSGGALLNEMLETAADHPVDSKIWYREDEARADAFFVTYVTLGDLWSHGAFSAVKPGSWQARLRDYLVGAGVSEEAIANAHVDPATFMEETTSRLWELGIDVVHVMLTQSGHGLATAEAVGEGSEVAAKAAEARGYGGDAKNNTEVLRAILGKFPESPTVCLKRRNTLDAYVSLYRAEHGETPWQRLAEPPPAPRAPVTAEEARTSEAPNDASGGMTGAWKLEASLGAEPFADDSASNVSAEVRFTDGKNGKASAEAFGAFDSVPGDASSDAASASSSSSVSASGPRRVRFDPAVFRWLEDFEVDWLAEAAATTRELGARECAELTYEDNLADEGRQAQTLEWLRKRFHLRLNVDALPLQKLRRVSTTPTRLVDFENPDALDARARSFLHDDDREANEGR